MDQRTVETVKIQKGAGYVIINKADFDPAKHALYGANLAAPASPPAGSKADGGEAGPTAPPADAVAENPDLGADRANLVGAAVGGSHDAGKNEGAKKVKGK